MSTNPWIIHSFSSYSWKTGVNCCVYATVTNKDLEGTLVTPSVVPRVNTNPVVLTVLNAPTDYFDGVTSSTRAGLVRVNSRLIGQKVLVDRESSGDRTVS